MPAAAACRPAPPPDPCRCVLLPCRPRLQLVSRRFPAGSSQVTAFVASPGAAAGLAGCASAAELRERYRHAAVSLLVTVLCPPEELGSAAASALEALAGNGTSSSSGSSDEAASGSSSDEEGSEAVGSSSRSSRIRLVSYKPVRELVARTLDLFAEVAP